MENLHQTLIIFFSLIQDLINQLNQTHKFLHHLYDSIMFLHMLPLPIQEINTILFFVTSFVELLKSTS